MPSDLPRYPHTSAYLLGLVLGVLLGFFLCADLVARDRTEHPGSWCPVVLDGGSDAH